MKVSDDLTIDFNDFSGEGIRVAIVDTGIDYTHQSVGAVSAGTWLKISSDGTLVEDPKYADDLGHGTACAAIVRSLAPRCELLVVKITCGTESIPPELLAAGIDWAVCQGAKVINISAGTTGTHGAILLANSCRKAADAGAIVVASESGEGYQTYPAALDHVLTVSGGAVERSKYAYRSDPSLPRRFVAYSGHQKVAWTEPQFVFISGVSFAAARLTGIIALILEKFGKVSREQLLEILRCNAVNSYVVVPVALADNNLPSPASRSIDWIKRAVIYPYSKEMHSLVRFRHLLPFELMQVVDPPAKGCVGKDAGELINLPRIGLRVLANLEEALRNADTLILGFTNLLSTLQHRDLGTELVRRAIELGKNVYSFEPLDLPHHDSLMSEATRRQLRIGWPKLDDSDLEELRQKIKLPVSYAQTPILGVFGTSPVQGKFTLQLLLREQLLALGFKVGQIGSEHQSELFGMDDCFPNGYIDNVSLRMIRWKEYFDLRYQQIVRDRQVDIIVVGSQGGVIPYSLTKCDSDLQALTSLLYLTATQADSYILVVNHLDEHQFIQDTLDVLRIIGKGRTILLALSNRRKRITKSFGRNLVTTEIIDSAEQAEYIRRLEDRFELPTVTILDENGPQRMIDVVLAAYATKN